MIRKVTSYDGALLEQNPPAVHDVISPDVARTMVAMLEDVVKMGTGQAALALGRPAGGKTGTTNNFSDAWFIGFTPQLTAGVWVGNDDKQISLGKRETGAVAALPIWLQFMKASLANQPIEDFPNVIPLEQLAPTHNVKVDTLDTAPTEGGEEPPGAPATPGAPSQSPPGPPANAPPQR
jgi:penicillin-binding protein 1A